MPQNDKPDKRVIAIRADAKVGRGSGSFIDECCTEAELVAILDENGARTVRDAVALCRRLDRYERGIFDDVRASGGW